MPTIICLQKLSEEQQELVRRTAPDYRIVFARSEDVEDNDYREAEIICGWNPKVEQLSLGANSKLGWVQSWSSGIDNLPLGLLEESGVRLTDASGVHARSVSETVLALMLGLSRGIVSSVHHQRAAVWQSPSMLAEMNGSTVAIIGAGQIGREVARLARAFEMKIIGVRRSGGTMPEADETFAASHLNEVLHVADYVVNILPLTSETQHLFDASRFAQMKHSAHFINVGRGATVRTEDLVAALTSGTIAGAGLDVFEQEPLPSDHPLWTLPNVIMTPHIAGGSTLRNTERLLKLFVSNLEIYLSGDKDSLHNLLDYRKQY
ncbi:MAG: D-2-hydroxyacid dehydrogenase [Gorillibacterium sp.]|nr:D-2-hydroxyacid dehydrogenase [Gorillibacterium sp.]